MSHARNQTSRKYKYEPLESMKRVWGLMSISERIMAVLTLLAVLVAGGTGYIIWQQKQEMKTDQRAWVGFDESRNWNLVAGKEFYATISVRNIGKTPARRVAAGFFVLVCPKNETLKYDELLQPYIRPSPSALLLPNQVHEMTAHIRGENDPIPDAVFNDIQSGKAVIYLIAKVTYVDVFGINHWTKYCYASGRLGIEALEFRPCGDYNGIDENEQ